MAINVISSDSHVVEPPDLWLRYIDPKYRDRAPHLVHEAERDVYWCDSKQDDVLIGVTETLFPIGMVSAAGKTNEELNLTNPRWDDEVRPGAYEPNARLEDMALDGVDADVIYPTMGMRLYAVADLGYRKACLDAYNRWLAEELVGLHPDLLKGVGMITLDDVPWSVEQLLRFKGLGLSGAMISSASDDRRFASKDFDPVWAAAEDQDLPVTLHVTTVPGQIKLETPADVIAMNMSVSWIIGALIYTGVFERYPKLKVVSAENDTGWAAYYVAKMEMSYEMGRRPGTLGKDLSPSDLFHRNVFLSFQSDPIGIKCRDVIGVDNLMWGNDYPHREATWPHSRELFQTLFAGVPQGDRRKILRDNAARLYHFDLG